MDGLMTKWWRQLFVLCSWMLAVPWAGAQDFWSALRIIQDPQAQFTPQQAWLQTQTSDVITLAHPHQVLSAANSPPFWAGVRLGKDQFAGEPLWLSLKSPTQDQSQVWLRFDDQAWQAWPDMQQSMEARFLYPVWNLPPPPHQTLDVLIRLHGVNRVQFPVDFQSPQTFAKQHFSLVLFIGAVLAVPLMMILFAIGLMPFVGNPSLRWFVLMALCEVISASWVSGLLCFLMPSLSRSHAALWGSVSYGLLFVASIHHAQIFLKTATRHPMAHQVLKAGAWFWYGAVPLCVWLQPEGLRFLLLAGGTLHAIALLLLAWMSWQRHPSTALALFMAMWLVYVTSVVVYWLYRWFEWPLLITLGVHFVQGAFMASLMGLAACLQVVKQRIELQRRVDISHARHLWYAAAQHDLWQPLQSVQLYARALLQVTADKRPRLVAALQLASQSVDDYMHQLRYWAHDGVQDKPGPVLTQTMPIHELLSSLVQEFQPLACMRYVVLRYRSSKAVVCIDPLAVQRMVRNLLANALRYTSAGGRVILGCKRQGPWLWVLCIDNGSGMNSQAAQDCFNAFTRSAPDDEGEHHLGLGLFSVKQLAMQHQLPTRLYSIEGRGTLIGVGLPLV